MKLKLMKLMSERLILKIACCCGLALLWNACREEYYTVNDSFYDDKAIEVKNPLIDDTLRIELYNTDLISIQEVSRPDIVFDPRAFIYQVEYDSILSVSDEGEIQPQNRGVTKISIIFRANAAIATSMVVEVHKDYHAVERLQVPSAVSGLLVEQDYTLNLSPYIIVYPSYADNKQLHFSLDAASQAFASISEDGVITGIAPGPITVHVVSDDNPQVTADALLNVITEIEITDIKLHAQLDNITLGLDEQIDLNVLTSVTPANVNEVNRRLHFALTDGADAVSLTDGLLTAVGAGVAHLTVSSKNNITKTFTIHVDAAKKDLTRAFWTVTTSASYSTGLNYVVDGTTGKPEDMFDDNPATFLSLVKSGKTYNNSAGPASGGYNHFIVDMRVSCTFSAIRWNHRSGNSYNYLRIWGIDLEGSPDGENWSIIQQSVAIPIKEGADATRYEIPLNAEHTYRYVKVTLTQWSDNSGGSTSGSTMQIGEFGLIR
jgi:hypothetical protein